MTHGPPSTTSPPPQAAACPTTTPPSGGETRRFARPARRSSLARALTPVTPSPSPPSVADQSPSDRVFLPDPCRRCRSVPRRPRGHDNRVVLPDREGTPASPSPRKEQSTEPSKPPGRGDARAPRPSSTRHPPTHPAASVPCRSSAGLSRLRGLSAGIDPASRRNNARTPPPAPASRPVSPSTPFTPYPPLTPSGLPGQTTYNLLTRSIRSGAPETPPHDPSCHPCRRRAPPPLP